MNLRSRVPIPALVPMTVPIPVPMRVPMPIPKAMEDFSQVAGRMNGF